MNILFFVMSLLMLLTLLTYGRLESFRHFGFVQAEFEKYMEHTERRYLNQEAIKKYKSYVASREENQEQNKNEKHLASSKLSFRLFMNKQERERYPGKMNPHRTLAKQLISVLYGNQPFYKELEESRPAFVEEILEKIIQESENQTSKELENIDLGSMELNQVFTKMLKGSVNKEISSQAKNNAVAPDPLFKDYPPLKDFITLQSNKLTIRIYLASLPLLMAIYGHQDIVNEICMARNHLYREVKNDAMTTEEAGVEFSALCKRFSGVVSESMLNFDVSKTNPKSYH